MSLNSLICDQRPFQVVERDFFRPNLIHPYNQIVPKDYFKWENAFRPFENMFKQMEQLASVLNNMVLKESPNASSDYNEFQINVDVQHFAPEEINVKVVNGYVTVEGKHEEKRDEHGYVSRHFVRRYALPKGCLPDTVESKLSSDGVLTVTAPKVLPLPSIGERIVPITHTGPVKKKIGSGAEALIG